MMIETGTTGDCGNAGGYAILYAWHDIQDLLSDPTNLLHWAGYYCRYFYAQFTDTTFEILERGYYSEVDSRAPEIFKIYGYKFD